MKSQLMQKIVLIFFFTTTYTSCGKIDRFLDEITQLREQSVLALNDGINAIQNESSDWQIVLRELADKMDKRVSDIMTYNIPYIINLASQRALSSVLCVKESIKEEILYYLEVAKAELITGVLPPLPETKICLTSLSTLDLNSPRNIRNQVVYTGIYIHTKDSITACWVNNNSKVKIPISKLGFPDISNITLSLSDFDDNYISNFTHLVLKYNNEVISSIGIDKKIPDPIVKETVSTRLTNIVYIPPHTYGDRDFKGNGPKMISHVYLKHDGIRVFAQVYLSAQETKSDWTTAAGYSNWIEIYTVRSGYRINKIKDPITYYNILRSGNNEYIDNSHLDFPIPTPVGNAVLVGDTDGSEAGSKTKITLNLKSFLIEIQKQ